MKHELYKLGFKEVRHNDLKSKECYFVGTKTGHSSNSVLGKTRSTIMQEWDLFANGRFNLETMTEKLNLITGIDVADAMHPHSKKPIFEYYLSKYTIELKTVENGYKIKIIFFIEEE